MTALTQITPSADSAEFRAAGTDLSERRRSGVSRGPLVDIVPTAETTGIAIGQTGALRIGASTTIAAIAASARVAEAYPGFAAAASGLATPQIRQLATLGGNLAQRSRCWYYRNPHFSCLKKGGADCPAREGNHLYGVAFDLGPCVAPHPSTMATALMAYDARVDTTKRKALTIEQLLGDGSNGAADHALGASEMIARRGASAPAARANARPIGAPSAALMRNGRLSNSSCASSSPMAHSEWCASRREGSRPCRFASRRPRALRKAPLSRLRQSRRPRAPRPSAPSLCR